MDSAEFDARYRETVRKLEARYRDTRSALESGPRRAFEVEQERILANVERMLDAPGRARAAALSDRMTDLVEHAPPPIRSAPPRSIDDLDVRSLHTLAKLDSMLRHSIVESCLMNLRTYADLLDERAEDPGFRGKLASLVGLLPGVAKQVKDFFTRPRVLGVALAELLPGPFEAALLAVEGVLWIVDRVRSDGKKPDVSGAELAKRVDALTEALSGVHRALDERRASVSASVLAGLEAHRPALEAAGIRVVYEDATGGDTQLFLNPASLANAVGEILRNALRHGFPPDHPERSIRVRLDEADAPGAHIRIVVEDTGRGFAPGVREHATRPGVSTSGGGAGLSHVNDVAEEHLGRLEIADREGGGARVSIVLPRHPSLEARRVES